MTVRRGQGQPRETYRIADLKHRPCNGGFITAHDILELEFIALLLRSQHGPPHYRGELVLWEVLVGGI